MQNKDSDDDMPPDLEDVPEDLLTAAKNKESKAFIGDYTDQKPDQPPEQIIATKSASGEADLQKKSGPAFGFKKGFLSGGSGPKKPVEQKKKEEPIVIKPTKGKDDWKRLPEVQQSMKQTIINKKDQWMTPELINQLQSNPELLKLFTNPEYMQAIKMMQTNPKEVMEKYKDNPEFTKLMVEFSKVMGGHFNKIGEQEKAKQQPATDPEAVLKDPKVKQFLAYLQRTPKVDFHAVMRADPALGKNLQVLMQKGYININQG